MYPNTEQHTAALRSPAIINKLLDFKKAIHPVSSTSLLGGYLNEEL